MSIYWESPYTGKKHIIGSTPYFLDGLNHIRNPRDNLVYNPYKNDYVVRGGAAYDNYRLADLYSMAEKVSFDLSENCTRVYVKYPIGVSKKMDTLKFIKYLQAYDNKYKIYTFDRTFYEKIVACVDDKSSLRALELKEYLMNLRTITLDFASKVNMTECARKLRENKICTKQDLERFRNNPVVYKQMTECLEYILIKGIDIGCRELKVVPRADFDLLEPVPVAKVKPVPEELEVVIEPTPEPVYGLLSRGEVLPEEPPEMKLPAPEEPKDIVVPEPVAERKRVIPQPESITPRRKVPASVFTTPAKIPAVEVGPVVPVTVFEESEEEEPEVLDLPSFPSIPSVVSYDVTPIPSVRRPLQVPETIVEAPEPEPLFLLPAPPLKSKIKPVKKVTKTKTPLPTPVEGPSIPEPEPSEPWPLEMELFPPEPEVEKRGECLAKDVSVPDSCDNYRNLYLDLRPKLAEFSNPGCIEEAREKQASVYSWYNRCLPKTVEEKPCPSASIEIPKTCDNWEEFYERNKLVFDPDTNPGCPDEANQKDLALNEWRNACRSAPKVTPKEKGVADEDIIRKALGKRRQAIEEENDEW